MSLDKAVKIVKIFDEDGIAKIARKSFTITITTLHYCVPDHVFEKMIKPKTQELVKWIDNEITMAKAHAIHDVMTSEEMDYVLEQITNPVMLKLINALTKPNDSFFLSMNALEIELVGKFIALIKEEDTELAKNIEENMKSVMAIGSKPKSALN